jgi:deoxyribonuclease V
MIPAMLAVLDAHYDDDAGTAAAACVVAATWTDAQVVIERRVVTPIAAGYTSGALYLRELPPLLAVLATLPAITPLTAIAVDGHAWLAGGQPGLGARLHAALGGGVAVVGIAKRAHHDAPALAVHRGASASPLWVSAVGLDPADACARVAAMAGEFRLPELVKRADHLARGIP